LYSFNETLFNLIGLRPIRIFYRILLYLSIILFVIYLCRTDYIVLSQFRFDYLYLILSLIFLWTGFVLSTVSWWYSLKAHHVKTKVKSAIVSHGILVFAKYIPGKIWVILGRASRITQKGISLELTSMASLREQLIYVLLGLVISFIPMVWYYGFGYFSLIVLITIILLVIILFSKDVFKLSLKILTRVFKREFNLPVLQYRDTLNIGYFVLLYWGFWIIAFYCFLKSVLPTASFDLSFAFPLSVSYGVLAIFVPGGIGVRESILTGYLIIAGINTETSVTISIVSRLWFITGEIFLFTLSVLMNNLSRDRSIKKSSH
jgi:hypothetical protein